ncbi:hypothetical protein ElyMa_001747200 [Elysia marginata]|uniref:Uncharacterized protein n=1 Tax=Elysia marginata TaxID=1093978 RepID=A0AAV4EA57_9GAST|nr:hypothetical protein ElyMa_001747200 [Elysia marginata]
MVQGSGLEVKSFLEVFIDSLPSFDIDQSFTTIINDQIPSTSILTASLPCGGCTPFNLDQIEPSANDTNNSVSQYTLDDLHLQSITDVLDNSLSGGPTYIQRSDFEKFKTSIMDDILNLKNSVRELEEKLDRQNSASLDLSRKSRSDKSCQATCHHTTSTSPKTTTSNNTIELHDSTPITPYRDALLSCNTSADSVTTTSFTSIGRVKSRSRKNATARGKGQLQTPQRNDVHRTAPQRNQHHLPKISQDIQEPSISKPQEALHYIFGDSTIKGIYPEVMSSSARERVEIFPWARARMEHLLQKIQDVDPAASVTRVTIHAGFNDSQIDLKISSNVLSKLVNLLHVKFKNVVDIAFSSIVLPTARGACLDQAYKNNTMLKNFVLVII